MKGYEIETKDEKSQMYLENNLNEIKNKFPNIHNKYPRFFQYIANKEKENINYEILSNKVDGIKKDYTKNVKNYIEKAYDDLFLSNKKIDNIFYIKVKKWVWW